MGIVRNPANTMRRGRVGETTYYISGGQQIARQALNGSNFGESARRSTAQQKRRVMWANLVNFYKASRTWMPKAFETKKRNQSDYNKFMQLNINSAQIALTKSEAEAGACVAGPFIVSQGSLPSISIYQSTYRWRTNIGVGSLEISDSTSVAEFSRAMIDNNANVRQGMQLSFVSYQQSIDVMNVPRLICRCYEVTIDTTNQTPLYASFPDFCASTMEGFLATSDNISVGGFAYILSELTTSGIAVSTQNLVLNNSVLYAHYTLPEQLTKAIESYGVDSEVVLSPISTVMQSPEDQPRYIQSMIFNGNETAAGGYFGKMSTISGKSITLKMSNTVSVADIREIIALGVDGGSFDGRITSVSGTYVTVQMDAEPAGDELLQAIRVVYTNNDELELTFDTSKTGGDL